MEARNDAYTMTRPTIRDIAAETGVSIATVSRVVNGRPDVAPDTRERVLRYVREHGWVSSRAARGLAGQRTGLVALTVPYMAAEYFGEIMEGVADALYERDARLVVCPTQHHHEREVSFFDRVMHGTTDGAIIVLPSESESELLSVRERGYPFVVIDARMPIQSDIPVVTVSHWSGARTATAHLTSLGHRRIAAITGPPEWTATIDRLAGYHAALVAAGAPSDDSLVVEGDFLIDSGYEAARRLLSLPEPPTAIFAFNDNMAVGVLQAAREAGICVPNDLSVVGFDDAQAASVMTPRLTTIRQPLQEMGRVAAALLYRLLDGHNVDATRLELSTRLVVRESTAPPRS